MQNGKIILSGATKDAIKAMPKFEYAKQGVAARRCLVKRQKNGLLDDKGGTGNGRQERRAAKAARNL